ncbi:GNAT family N-acetyltransferase [Mucilaginibacter myungsuensis]|uniref:GNAT family N-acetyltransferase n=1 Tax=Mucilaginibacter myungsuensis TaxID=649104 RepID=A0A929PX19_9SPHI|nr:GNAT family N-acetyltransferase [Mucilaginibacter myungsuensis]MBE9661777.1 GNAT family N-acetyltransferase [Mucilaginibacter myungsuensis]MDN3599789.1 GNAT family N-acetyltransferase [Mucilaginibacter myungsuensis]
MLITLHRITSANPDFRLLITQLDADLREMYADLMDSYDQHNIIEQIDTVVIAYHDDAPVGCGCFKAFDSESVELKRMFVARDARGKGISKLVLAELENWAAELGYRYTVLETGSKNIEAQALYRKSGYGVTPSYGPYVDLPDSVCMRKCLNR